MKDQCYKWLGVCLLSGVILLNSSVYSQATYPYSSGQAVFVQSPYNSSVYTEYRYAPNQHMPNRLPPYTTNQAVFVQQPYATTQQTITSYPTTGQYSLPYTQTGYSTPIDYPSTLAPTYPFSTVGGYPSSPYSITTQYPSYTYPYSTPVYTTTEVYPYITTRPSVPAGALNQPNGLIYPSSTSPTLYPSYNTTSVYPYNTKPTLYPGSTENAYPTLQPPYP